MELFILIYRKLIAIRNINKSEQIIAEHLVDGNIPQN